MNSYEVLSYEYPDSELFEDNCFNDIDKLDKAEICKRYVDNYPSIDSYCLLNEFKNEIKEGLTGDNLNIILSKFEDMEVFPLHYNSFQMEVLFNSIIRTHEIIIKFLYKISNNKKFKYRIHERNIQKLLTRISIIFGNVNYVPSYKACFNTFMLLKSLGYMGEFVHE